MDREPTKRFTSRAEYCAAPAWIPGCAARTAGTGCAIVARYDRGGHRLRHGPAVDALPAVRLHGLRGEAQRGDAGGRGTLTATLRRLSQRGRRSPKRPLCPTGVWEQLRPGRLTTGSMWNAHVRSSCAFCSLTAMSYWLLNCRQTDTTPFMRAYDALPDEWRNLPAHRRQPPSSDPVTAKPHHPLFGDVEPQVRFLEKRTGVRLERFSRPRTVESSTPLPGDPRHEPMMAALRQLFDAHQENGKVVFHYNTLVRYGRL